ncbi:MAG: oxidoreductase-like domain-containing protein [Stagnimonas sp.]|nr:oxidoreductase-like domain-containing protein [Stagnimonas sp.]
MPPAPEPEPPLPPRPQMPGEEECCHSDCALCVFTLYERRLERWEQAVAGAQARRLEPGAD